MRHLIAATSLFALAACGFNGTDRYKNEQATQSTQQK